MSKDHSFTRKGFNYFISNGRLTLGSSTNLFLNAVNDSSVRKHSLVLESHIGKRRVKDINTNAFRAVKGNNDEFIEILDIQEGFERILEHAFRDQCNIKTVIIPESVYQISEAAFHLHNLTSGRDGQITTTFIFRGKSKLRTLDSMAISGQESIIISIAVYKDIIADESITYLQAKTLNVFTPLGTKFSNIDTIKSMNDFSVNRVATCKKRNRLDITFSLLFIFILK